MAGIYLHIPFCKQACTYCNFHFSTSLRLKDDVLHAMMKEIEMQRDYLQGAPVETIYFGGGTPSLLSAEEINRLIDHVLRFHPVDELQEVTLEANPDDLNAKYLRTLRGTPVNRFSIGIQSFRDEDLQYMHRAHNAQQADYSIKAAQDAGFTNLSIDLIYGTPGLKDSDWKQNLQRIKDLSIPHFSAYALTVEEGTALHYAISKKKTAPVLPEQAASQFEMLMDVAPEMGHEHYEISNLALPGMHALHNTNYWNSVPYLGIGPAAHSFNGKMRSWNIANNALYAKGILTDKHLPHEHEVLTPVQQLNEYIMTSIRTMWGCDLNKIAAQWGNDYAILIEHGCNLFLENNWVTLEGKTLKLTNIGRLFADSIAADLFVDENLR